jgi:hypothetical protein
MGNIRHAVLVVLAVIFAAMLGRAGHAAETRFALVVGNDEYKATKLATPSNDARACRQRSAGSRLYCHRRSQPRSVDLA